MTMKFIPVGDTKAHLQVGSGLPVEIDTAGNLKAAGKVQGQPATAVGDVVTFEQAFGVGQGLIGYTIGAQRSPDTIYTNTTGKRITVIAYGTATGGSEQGILGYIGDNAQYPCASVFRSGLGNIGISFDVPDGLSYKITTSASLAFWLEIR